MAKNDTAYREYFNFRVRSKEGGSEAMDGNVMYGDEKHGFAKSVKLLLLTGKSYVTVTDFLKNRFTSYFLSSNWKSY